MKHLAKALGPPLIIWRNCFRSQTARDLAGILLLWAVYLAAVELVASAAAREFASFLPHRGDFVLHGFVADLNRAPPLARWDSIWYYEIALEGYSGSAPESRHTPAFLPFYPLMMRLSSLLFSRDLFTGGIWVSRLALFAALCLLACYVRDTQPRGTPIWSALVAMLAFPTAFILVSVYSESLFLALSLAAFMAAHRRRYWIASLIVFAASLTRIQGVALVGAFLAMAARDWLAGNRRLIALAPMLGGVAGHLGFTAYCYAAFGNPFYHFSVKREVWHQGLASPWSTLDSAIAAASAAAEDWKVGSLYTILEIPVAYLVLVTAAVLAFGRGGRYWPECAFVACSLAMSLFGGGLGGMPRFALVLFPVFVFLAQSIRYAAIWYGYLIAASLVQTCLVINYVSFRLPPP